MTRAAVLPLVCVCLLLATASAADPAVATEAKIAIVEKLRAALAREDYAAAATFLSDDPRVWYEKREGAGSPWRLGAGRWRNWDRHFNGVSTLQGNLEADGDRVWGDFTETNDYYRLTGRGAGHYRMTWFFDSDGKIAGRMISAVPGAPERDPGRFDEFEAWAREHHPEELDYLLPGGRIDPTGDRAPRFRQLLERWREAIGEPLDLPPPSS